MTLEVGDVITLKKAHPCGSKEWEVLRVGMDLRLKCLGCKHMMMVPRNKIVKNIKVVKKNTDF